MTEILSKPIYKIRVVILDTGCPSRSCIQARIITCTVRANTAMGEKPCGMLKRASCHITFRVGVTDNASGYFRNSFT